MVAAMIHDEEEIERLKPVWAALSELWLDTELTADDLQRIAGVMNGSGQSLDEWKGYWSQFIFSTKK